MKEIKSTRKIGRVRSGKAEEKETTEIFPKEGKTQFSQKTDEEQGIL